MVQYTADCILVWIHTLFSLFSLRNNTSNHLTFPLHRDHRWLISRRQCIQLSHLNVCDENIYSPTSIDDWWKQSRSTLVTRSRIHTTSPVTTREVHFGGTLITTEPLICRLQVEQQVLSTW